MKRSCESDLRSRHPFAAAASLLVTVVLAGCGLTGGGAADGGGVLAPAVEALPARTGSLPLEEELSGVVRAHNQVAIRAEISGTVVEVAARNGDRVERGRPLVRLDDARLREQLRQAEASLRLAEATAAESRARVAEIEAEVRRTRALARDRLVSELELETREAQLLAAQAGAAQAEARVEQVRAEVEERRADLARTVVRAPTGGLVGQRNVEVGMVVGPGDTLFLLGDFDDLVVEVPLTQTMLQHVGEGTPAEIEVRDRVDGPILAAVSRISPFLEAGSFSTEAEIDVPGEGRGLRPGMFVTVRVLYGATRQATLLPASALWEDPGTGERTVFVIEEAVGLSEAEAAAAALEGRERAVAIRPVEVLAEGRGQMGVAGVDDGEWVVTLGQHLLHRAMQAEGAEALKARVRPTSWETVLGHQELTREDLLSGFLAKQRQLARAIGAEVPEDPEVVDQVLGISRQRPAEAPAPAGSDVRPSSGDG